MPLSGEPRERVTLWSGCRGLTALAGVSGQRPERVKGRALSTTTVVIVGYIKGKPFISLHARYGTFSEDFSFPIVEHS